MKNLIKAAEFYQAQRDDWIATDAMSGTIYELRQAAVEAIGARLVLIAVYQIAGEDITDEQYEQAIKAKSLLVEFGPLMAQSLTDDTWPGIAARARLTVRDFLASLDPQIDWA